MGYFTYAHYALAVRFYGLESIHSRYIIKDVIFFVSSEVFFSKQNSILIFL